MGNLMKDGKTLAFERMAAVYKYTVATSDGCRIP